jgi:putative ABC transport system permease protein
MKEKIEPPKLLLRFFRWYCHPKLLKYIEGDLRELYGERLQAAGKRKANIKFMIDVLLLFRPGIIKPWERERNYNQYGMLKNYFTISWRNILKNKAFSAINVFGLAIGLAACLLILQFVIFELSFDQFNTKLERTYRITNDRFQNGKLIQHGTIMYPTIGPTMAKDFPEIEEYARVMPTGETNVRIEDRNYRGDLAHFVDQRFFNVFDFALRAGDRATLLSTPYTAVLTEEVARKYFQFTDDNFNSLIGKTFLWGLDTRPYEVKGIIENIPANSHLQFDVLFSYSTLLTESQDADLSWTWSDMRHYLVLKPGVNYKDLEAKFPEFSERYFKGTEVSGSIEKFYLQPMKDAHLYSDYEYDVATTASGKAVWSMLIVAVFILVIAWINYINLTTSRAIERAKEVGVRKVMGAFQTQLIKQFIFESVLITTIAVVVAIAIMTLLQSSFNQIVGSELSWKLLTNQLTTQQVLIVAAALVGGAIISGFYPAFMLSNYQPVTVLKGKFTRSAKGSFLRKALVVFQFTASAALISGTLIVSRQIEFMNQADLGINLKNVLVVRAPELAEFDSTFIPRVEAFKNELTKISGVVSATTSGQLPGDRLGRTFNIRLSDQPVETNLTVSFMGVNYDFFETMGIRVLAGRYFLPTDHNADFRQLKSIIINRNAMNLFGIKNPEEAIGKEIIWGNNGTRKWTIIGVVNDYHQEALHKPMEPIVFRPLYGTFAPISIKTQADDATQLLASVEKTYKKFFAGNSFEYFYLNDKYNNQYSDDTRFGKVVSIFTVLAIIVACLGLIGLSSYTAIMRTKEIGIRKVLGASVVNIVSILSVDFVKLVVIASILSLPIAYYSMNKWLEAYTYKINLGWVLFVLPLLMVIAIAAITIGFQVLKTALAKPVDTLKYE